VFGTETVALAHNLVDEMHCLELFHMDKSASHVSMKSPRGGI
jgi:hypothetical protein